MAEKTIKALEKGIDLLFLFDATRQVRDVKDIAAALGLPLRTTYRVVNTLRKRHALLIEERTGRCRLSPRWRRLIPALEAPGDLTRVATPVLTDLAWKSGETVQLFVLSGGAGVLAHAIESPQTLRVGPRIGERVPLHCGAGTKALLAFRPPEEWDAYIRRNGLKRYAPNTVTDPETLKRQLRQIRRAGFVVTYQEYTLGARALGVPIWDPAETVTASLSVTGPGPRGGMHDDHAAGSIPRVEGDYAGRQTRSWKYSADSIGNAPRRRKRFGDAKDVVTADCDALGLAGVASCLRGARSSIHLSLTHRSAHSSIVAKKSTVCSGGDEMKYSLEMKEELAWRTSPGSN